MPETRAAKRIKLTNPIKQITSPRVPAQSQHKVHLTHLNSLQTSAFLKQFVPEELRSFRPRKQHTQAQERREYKFEYHDATSLPKQDFERCFALIEDTSRADYASSSRRWHAVRKRAEMREENMRYFIVRPVDIRAANEDNGEGGCGSGSSSRSRSQSISSHDTQSEVVRQVDGLDRFGFMSFQLDDDWVVGSDERIPILYLYEIHLGTMLRGVGLGCHLMNVARHIALVTKMHKVELSVFTVNVQAESFYRSLGYETDETSPVTVRKGKKRIKTDWLVLSLDLRHSLTNK